MNREEQLTAILNQIQSDLVGFRTHVECEIFEESEPLCKFYDGISKSMEDFETLTEKELLVYPELPIYANVLLNNSIDLIKIKNAN